MKNKTLGEALTIRLIRRTYLIVREGIIAAIKVPSRTRFIIFISALFASLDSFALPWVEVGDERTRHHLTYLRDTGAINMPLNTWPVSWADISREMGQMHLDKMNEAQLWSYRYLRHELDRAQRGIKTTKRFHVAINATPFADFISDTQEKNSASSETTFMNERFAVNIDAQVIDAPLDGHKYTFDGSFAAATLGNWAFGVGNVERWWGPGWHSSLTLSNNARPTAGIFAKRLESLGIDSPYFSIIGPWTIEFFASELEELEEERDSNLYGGRFAINPLQNLEIGISNTSLETGNENKQRMALMGYDARFSANLNGTAFSLFAQVVEKVDFEAELDPSTLFGADISFPFKGSHNRIIFEMADSEGEENPSSGLFESVYDHGVYQNAYRHKGKLLSESAGTNAEKQSVSGQHFFSNGHQVSWRYSDITINESGPSLNFYGAELIEQSLGELRYAFPFNEMTLIEIGAFQLRESMERQSKRFDSGSSLTISIRI